MTMDTIKLILLFSGKRKCGKDHISEKLLSRLGTNAEIIRISEPIKAEWAKKLNLDLKMLLSDGPYKEKYRKAMIEWSDGVREEDYGFFCQKAISFAVKQVIIVSDIRRKNDIKYFRLTFGDRVRTIRISCADEIRVSRGWKYQVGVDDVQSECDLDNIADWDMCVENDGSTDSDKIVEDILDRFHLRNYVV